MFFHSISSNIDEVFPINPSANAFVFGDFNAHHKDWLTYPGATGRPVNYVIIFLSQITLLRWLTFLFQSQTVILTLLLFWIYLFLLLLVFVLQWLSLCWEILIIFSAKTLKYWVGVQQEHSYLMGRRCLLSLGWPPF